MSKELIIGRCSASPFKIADTYTGVSHEHARITISDSGEWWVENLSGPKGNGVFIKTGPDIFERVEKRRITEDTIIRLGENSYKSYTFMAHRAIEKPGNYNYEFLELRTRFKQYKAAIAEAEQNNRKRMQLANTIMIIFSIISVGIVVGALLLGKGVTGCSPMIFTGLVATMSRTLFGPKTEHLKRLQSLRQSEFVCPVCGRPMSDLDINNLKCISCKSS